MFSDATAPLTGLFAPAASDSPAPVAFVTNRFEWRAVEAEDYEQLASNLRAIGCPEKTIRDVVVARARRGLDQLSWTVSPKCPFWAAGLQRESAQREADRTRAAARTNLLARVERALGGEAFTEDGKLLEDFVEQAIVRFLSGPLSEEKLLRLAGILVRQQAQVEEVRTRAEGVWLAEDEAVLQNLRRQLHQELAALLLPAELEEFTARPAALKLADQVRLVATGLNPAEIREVALIRARFTDPGTGEWFEAASLSEEAERQAATAIREFLGATRYAQFERAGDRAFQELYDVGRNHDLPPDAALKAFEIRQIATQEAARLRADKSVSDATRQHQLARLQAQVQEVAEQILGAKACAHYLNGGGMWLTNLSGL